MPRSDRTSVGIALYRVEVQVAQGLHHHGTEGLVDLDEIDTPERHPASGASAGLKWR